MSPCKNIMRSTDVFGNELIYGNTCEPHKSFTFASRGIVLLSQHLIIEESNYIFRLPTLLTEANDEMVRFADEVCSFENNIVKDTLSLIERVKYTSLFTFIFSARPGTKAYSMADPVSREEKGKWFKELTDLQEAIAGQRTADMKGKTYRVLVEGTAKGEGMLSGRTQGNVIIEFPGDESLIGEFVDVTVTNPRTWIVYGEIAK